MTPPARVQAAIEILDMVIAAARDAGAAADTLITRYFGQRRYAGSQDRRAIREMVYAAIRRLGERPESGRAALCALAADDPALAAMFGTGDHAPAPITPGEPVAVAGVAPSWLVTRLEASGIDKSELSALVGRAPLDLRLNRLKPVPVLAGAVPIAGVEGGVRIAPGTDVEALTAWSSGAIEIQDAGSQVVIDAARATPGQDLIDLCAGAGGKTLALAAAMNNLGTLLAADIDRARLSRLLPRACRAGVSIVETRLLDPADEFRSIADRVDASDSVVIDAPCSGTGTWRRNPDSRWRLSPARLDRLVATQRRLLALGAALVKPGGALVYIVCSLLDEEGANQIEAFQRDHPRWDVERLNLARGRPRGGGVRLTPAHDDTDGFFVARLVRPC